MRRKFAVLFAVVVMFSALPMLAEVTLDPATGTGFVGKGDVQLPFGWNNKQLQDNANGLTFSLSDYAVYSQLCESSHGQGIQYKTFQRKRDINYSVGYAARRNSNGKDGDITGFYLTGFIGGGNGGPIPGTICGADNPNDNWQDAGPVTLVSGSEFGAELRVSYNGASHVLYQQLPPPTIE